MIRLTGMSMILAAILIPSWTTALRAADTTVREGRSAGIACSPNASVCAVLHDGSLKATDECAAQHEPAIRLLSGDCFDPD